MDKFLYIGIESSAQSRKETMFSRRQFIERLIGTAGVAAVGGVSFASTTAPYNPTVDRGALVRRHNPVLRKLDPLSPLSVGNGEFAFTADITGLQTFPDEYRNLMPLCTMSQWGWHTSPLSTGLDPKLFRLTNFDTHGRQVGYATNSQGQRELYDWLRENPHRLHLGAVRLSLISSNGKQAQVNDISSIEQTLDLWTGILTSKFVFDSKPIEVNTMVHPRLDVLAVSISSPLISDRRVSVQIAFPYGSSAMDAADWNQTGRHETRLLHKTSSRADFERVLDQDRYFVTVGTDDHTSIAVDAPHVVGLKPERRAEKFGFVVMFSEKPNAAIPDVKQAEAAAKLYWQEFWNTGAAIALAGSTDSRADELERRIVLSQYLTAIQCSGSLPPQETGLTVNSWYGKFHLEMHWWHAAHFALWKRLPLLEKSLGYYQSILPGARERARQQGYRGARWPKMTAGDGRDSPSPIGPLLIWQQPHPISYAELCYQTRPDRATLTRYREIVFETADFMASYAFWDHTGQRYVLGPPVIPAQENHPPRETWNPTYELEYWRHALQIAQQWRTRLHLGRDPEWDRVINKLAALPVRDGVYLAHENCPQTFSQRNSDHPSMLAALGMLPGKNVDRETMRRTLHKVMRDWRWEDTWGWDYPMTAMTAARLGEPEMAIDALLMKTPKNRYLPNGHNWQRANLPCYLPGNGGLLYAVAMMAGGWLDAPKHPNPGFPANGSWNVRAENFNTQLIGLL